MTVLADWQEGKYCEKHDMSYCADCLDQSKMRRDADGKVAYQGDCAVQTYVEITGEDYEPAAEALRAVGYVPGKGTPKDGLSAAFEAIGFQVREVTYLGLQALPAMSAAGRMFFVSADKGRKGHAWSVTDGQPNRAYQPPFRYRAFEVAA
jgi:hypothetical protein